MNTKTFAQQSRRILMQGVATKLQYWGFKKDGSFSEQPQKIQGGYTFRGEVFDDETVPSLWQALRSAVASKGFEQVVQEAAYTWFNRIMALQIMAKNGYEPILLENAPGIEHTPIMLQKARQGQYAYLNTNEQDRLKKIIADYSKDKEAFAILLIGYCHSNKTLNRVFGQVDDFTEILLPDNMLLTGGFLDLLNTTDAISEEDYKEVELIGWLYQFYISEKKDEVFASFKKNKKAEAKDIPAATQIFTPNWIVKYMVENTVGKIWLDKKPNSKLKGEMKYLVENADDHTSDPIIKDVEDLTLIDPACGSGHILVEGFDLLYQIYMEEYYTPEEAVESILKKNLYGLDIDNRAAQLANFAILLKAAKYYRDIFQKDWQANVYTMPEAQDFSLQEVKDFLGENGEYFAEKLNKALLLLKQGKNLGSIIKLDLPEEAINFISLRLEEVEQMSSRHFNLESAYQSMRSYLKVLLVLARKYAAVAANPPYMGSRNMNGELKQYVGKIYPDSKSDLFAVFMESGLELLVNNGLIGMINQHTWMFLSSYKILREKIILENSIKSLLHLGSRTFQELSGEVVQSTTFILKNGIDNSTGVYHRLVDCKSINDKEKGFLNNQYVFYSINQKSFLSIEGCPIAYWLSSNVLDLFKNCKKLSDFNATKKGMDTSNNNKFLRLWYEVDFSFIAQKYERLDEFYSSGLKWLPYNKGGTYRKWYGNNEYLILWDRDGELIKNEGGTIRNQSFFLEKSLTWNEVSTSDFCCRYSDQGAIFDATGPSIFGDNLFYILAFLNSKIANDILQILSPTIHYNVGSVASLPILFDDTKNVEEISLRNCVLKSKKDWDSRETSWDFEKSPLLNDSATLKKSFGTWLDQVSLDFFELHSNEEEINRIFIEIYGLQEELTQEVALKDITILQEELDRNALEALEPVFREKDKEDVALPINRKEVISQFISYAIGLFMGRYRLDKLGLNVAHPNPTKEELASYAYNHGTVTIDEDGIVPLMGRACRFPDDAYEQFLQLLDTIWGHEVRTENINFIQECLNKDLDKFLVNDFWKYHCKMYKNKPIYWLFSSKKGAFQVLVYMHRMNEFTVEKIRDKYLMPHMKHVRTEIAALEANESLLSNEDARKLDKLRLAILECEEYDMELKNVADQQIKIDLDDGVDHNYALFGSVVAKIK